MARNDRDGLQTKLDIRRAEFLVALAQGLTRDQSAEALRYRATADGVSVHAAALAVLTAEPTDELLISGSSRSVRPPRRRHLYVLRSVAADEHSATTSGVSLTPRSGRHRAR